MFFSGAHLDARGVLAFLPSFAIWLAVGHSIGHKFVELHVLVIRKDCGTNFVNMFFFHIT